MGNKELFKINNEGFITNIDPEAITNGSLYIPKHYQGNEINGIKGIAINEQNKHLINKVVFNGDIVVESRAFEGLPNLTNVTFSGKTNVQRLAFANNPNLLVVNFNSKEENTILADGSFSNCGIKDLSLPSNTETDIGAFANNPLINVHLLGPNIYLGDNTFSDCKDLSNVFSSEDCATILKESVFANCINLEEYENTETIIEMGNRAFADCQKFHGDKDKIFVISGKSGNSALENTSIETLIYKSSRNIPHDLIKNNAQLSKVLILGNATAIQSGAFENCINNNEIYIPSSMQYIGNRAFANNTNIHTMYALSKLEMFIKQHSTISPLFDKKGVIQLPQSIEIGKDAIPFEYAEVKVPTSDIKINLDVVNFNIKDIPVEQIKYQQTEIPQETVR